MDGDQRQDKTGHEQDVDAVEARDELGPGELAVEEQEGAPCADDGDRLDDAAGDLQAGPGEQIVGEGVAGEAGGQSESDERDADDPVELTRLAERAGEEHAHHVHAHGGNEEQRRPVVHLPDQQAAAYVKGDVQGGGVGLGHHDALEGDVGAVIDDLDHARLVEQGEEDTGQQHHDEAVEGDLTQHERPVVGEDLLEVAC
jgi:hypothetical protein